MEDDRKFGYSKKTEKLRDEFEKRYFNAAHRSDNDATHIARTNCQLDGIYVLDEPEILANLRIGQGLCGDIVFRAIEACKKRNTIELDPKLKDRAGWDRYSVESTMKELEKIKVELLTVYARLPGMRKFQSIYDLSGDIPRLWLSDAVWIYVEKLPEYQDKFNELVDKLYQLWIDLVAFAAADDEWAGLFDKPVELFETRGGFFEPSSFSGGRR